MNSKNMPPSSKTDSYKSDADQSVNIGALLIEARSNLDLSIDDIATHLNLSTEIINQLENNQFSGALPLAFIRGYLISYAMKVGLDVDMIKKSFDDQMGNESLSLKRVASLSVFEKNRNNFSSNNLSFKLVTFLIIAVVVFFAGRAAWEKYKTLTVSDTTSLNAVPLNNESNDVGLNSNEVTLDLPLEPVTTSENDVLNNDVLNNDTLALENTEKLNTVEQTTLKQTESTNLSANDSEQKNEVMINLAERGASEIEDNKLSETILAKENITLSFSADCWVQIIDASGAELAFGMKSAGKNMSLQGVPPISVVLGDPSVVDLSYKEQSIELSHYGAKRRANIILE